MFKCEIDNPQLLDTEALVQYNPGVNPVVYLSIANVVSLSA